MTLPPMHAYNFEHSALRYAHGARPTDTFSAHSEQYVPRPQRSRPDSISPTRPIRHSRRSSASEHLCTVAQNTCNMVCYLWFGRRGQRSSSSNTDTMQQFSPRPEFVSFISDLLATTQVSQSVITLALRYIYTLKQSNPSIRGRRGSEYRLAVTALMLANKFLDDNTYTNKTWSDVSRISLAEINQMEKEFLHGLGHNLYVDLATYESWVLMLTGLIDAKDRETEAYWHLRKQETGGRPRHLPFPPGQMPSSHRARSSSPTFPFTFTHPPVSVQQPTPPAYIPPSARPITLPPLDISSSTLVPTRSVSSGKRSAYDAFSPATASASALPFKRAIPSPDSLSPGSDAGGYLASAYVVDHSAGPRPDLKYLPYHTLASSPADNCGHGVRKAVLRYHELQSPSRREHRYPILPPIRLPQSACTSPKDYVYSSQHPPRPASRYFPVPPPITPQRDVAMHVYTPPYLSPQTNASIYTPPYQRQHTLTRPVYDTDMNELSPRSESGSETRRHSWYAPSPVIAPFANAGPPGVHWSQVPPPLRAPAPAPVYQQPTPTWSPIRGRRA
ncbi:cyclin, putative [Rhizoctonia solani AG-3 Rhs1AP]|uniref:Cyclin, amino-terminal domain protein n=2 Tax=Rhizoctonia solani AG-3 TaxID=1086053 RepID=A0A074RYG6_9AGAM|nr:cyclin, putative [Rhizoctonia solani AG-3 Rhs1AP]KEP52136.1 cyclin, amino-terminal domain protein [Rhizoctonia solani 123E]